MHDRGTTYSRSCRSTTLACVGRIMSSAQGTSVARVRHWPETTRIPIGRQGKAVGTEGGHCVEAAKVVDCGCRGVLRPLFE